MSKTLVIFDVDGTLVDSQHMICAAMDAAFSRHGLACPARAEVLAIVGLSLERAIARLGRDAPDFPTALLAEAYKAAFTELRLDGSRQEPLFPGAIEALDALARRDDVVLGLATGKSRRGVRAILDLHRLGGRFATIQTADTNPSKPDPGMVLAAMAESGVEAARTIVVGDTTYDVEMARGAGASALGVGWGYHPGAALTAAGASALLASFDELIPALDRRFAREPIA
jgi:phosphoglycolate phosphatase